MDSLLEHLRLGFIGGGNMASALLGGLAARGLDGTRCVVVEPAEPARAALTARFGVATLAHPAASLADCDALVIAVKPQQMRDAAHALAPHAGSALIVSVAAGIRSADLDRWLGGGRAIVRCMPNTPALIGAGMTGLYANPATSAAQRDIATALLGAVGETLWVTQEAHIDTVTALSGSGPAYVFYFIEAMQRAARELGLDEAAARQLSLATFGGAAQLAAQSSEPASVLRERVTSKGGTTYAALESMRADGVAEAIVGAIAAAEKRAAQMGEEFGRD